MVSDKDNFVAALGECGLNADTFGPIGNRIKDLLKVEICNEETTSHWDESEIWMALRWSPGYHNCPHTET